MTDMPLDSAPLPAKASAVAAPPARRRRLWQTLVPLLLVLVLGIGGKLASLHALRAVQALGRVEAQVSRVEVSALQMALSFRRDPDPGPRLQAASVVARQVMALRPVEVAQRFPADPVIAATLGQLAADAVPGRLSLLAAGGAVAEADALALLAASTADAVHAAIAVETAALWQRVWALGGGALAGLLLTAIGGSTIAAVALSKVQGFIQRVDDYARRLRQADAVRATAVAEAELAAVTRTRALMAETVARLDDARRLAEAARDEAESGKAATVAALEDTRRAGAAGRAILQALTEALETPLGRFQALSSGLQVGHTITAADRAALDEIERASARLNRVADGVLDVIRLDMGRATLLRQPFRPELLLERLGARLVPLARQSGVTFRITVDGDGVEACLGDPPRVEALLEALATYGIERARHGLVTLAQDGGVGLGFVLSGHGLPAHDLDAAAAADPGLGFVRAMALQMGGTLALEQGDGPALRLTLPLVPVDGA